MKGNMKMFILRHIQSQNGYLYEIPMIVILCAVAAALAAPLLPEPWKTVLFAALGVLVAVFLIYHFFIAGWRARHK